MKNKYSLWSKITFPIIILLLIGISFANCKKEEEKDPFAEFDGMASDVWAPQSFSVADISISEKTLIWIYQITNIEGFRLDRKIGSGPWEEGYRTFPKEVRLWNDTDIMPDESLTYYYRICAFAGDYKSDYDEVSSPIVFEAPLMVTLEKITEKKCKITWVDMSFGEQGFKIDHKVGDDPWEIGYGVVPENATSYTDTNVFRDLIVKYKVYGYYDSYTTKKVEVTTSAFECFNPIIDNRDGNIYKVIQIGDQCWMQENLAYLPGVSPSSNGWETTPYYYVYGYDGTNVSEAKATSNYQTYGALYNWSAALIACPQGWHLPADAEWTVLTTYLGGEGVAGGKMKETGLSRWNSPNTGATNSSGFTGLPGGYRNTSGSFYGMGYYGFFWSSSETSTTSAWVRTLVYNNAGVNRVNDTKGFGIRVRCLRD